MKTRLISLLVFFTITIYAGDRYDQAQFFVLNTKKAKLLTESFQQADSVQNEYVQKKSVVRAALYSAVIPGSGEYYGGSRWRAALFAGLEIIGWTSYFIYDSKGDKKTNEMEDYGDLHWNEQKYWSKMYERAVNAGLWDESPEEDGDLDLNDDTMIDDELYTRETKNRLRPLEGPEPDGLGYTHSLPETKNQQYYENIYKYLPQFGNGWDDAEWDETYEGYSDYLTPHMREYRSLRMDMNDLYNIATAFSNGILINHVISAIDAALVTRSYNRSLKIQSSIEKRKYFDEYVTMYGINISW